MISERPSGNGGASAGVSIGNYKGVMLCNRPFAGVAAAAHKAVGGGSGGNVPFRSAVIPHEPIGLNPSRERRAFIKMDRKKKNSVLSRHKKWLKQLQKAKEQFQQQAEEEEQKQENKRMRFAAQQAALRAEVRNTLEVGVGEADMMEMAASKLADVQDANDREITKEIQKINEYEQKNEENEEQNNSAWRDEQRERQLGDMRSKPAWALTAQQKDVLEDEEADDLMDFAQNLDVDKYLDDLEVRAALESVRNRIRQIEVAEDDDAQEGGENLDKNYESKYDDGDNYVKANKGKGKVKRTRLTKDALAAFAGDGASKDNVDDDARSVASHMTARSVLSDVKSLRGIHSAKSLAQLAKQVNTAKGGGALAAIPEVPFIPPRISIVDDKKGIRDEIKNQPSQLPYIHRNPAI